MPWKVYFIIAIILLLIMYYSKDIIKLIINKTLKKLPKKRPTKKNIKITTTSTHKPTHKPTITPTPTVIPIDIDALIPIIIPTQDNQIMTKKDIARIRKLDIEKKAKAAIELKTSIKAVNAMKLARKAAKAAKGWNPNAVANIIKRAKQVAIYARRRLRVREKTIHATIMKLLKAYAKAKKNTRAMKKRIALKALYTALILKHKNKITVARHKIKTNFVASMKLAREVEKKGNPNIAAAKAALIAAKAKQVAMNPKSN